MDDLLNLPSEPEYVAAAAGTNCADGGLRNSGSGCLVTDADASSTNRIDVPSMYSLIGSGNWKSYQEGMPGPCGNASGGTKYAAKHNPVVFFANLQADCATSSLPAIAPGSALACTASGCTLNGAAVDATSTIGGPLDSDIANGTLPRFSFVTPDLCNDMHDCAPGVSDQWMRVWLAKLLAGPNYRSGDTAIFVMWDEGTYGSAIPNMVIAPTATPQTVSTTMDDMAAARATLAMLGVPSASLPCIGGQQNVTANCPAGAAADLRAAFHV
jgi:phospholipase C